MSAPESLPRLLAWLATYGLHSTVLLGLAWLMTRPRRGCSARMVERIWRVGVLGPLVTATAASLLPHAPLLGVISLGPGSIAVVAESQFEQATEHEISAPPRASRDRGQSRQPAPRLAQDLPDRLPQQDAVARGPASENKTRSAPALTKPRRLYSGTLDNSNGKHQRRNQANPPAKLPEPTTQDTPDELLSDLLLFASAEQTSPERAAERSQAQGARTQLESAPAAVIAPAGIPLHEQITKAIGQLPRPSSRQMTALLWTLPALILAIALVCSAAKLAWDLRRRHTVQDADLMARFDALRRRAGLSRRVRLSISPQLQSPITFGLLVPEICLPPRALVDLTPAHERSLFAHELAHVARRDPAWFAGLALLERVFFFQPLLRVARKRLVEVAEERADDMAVALTGERVALASCLAEIAGWILESRRPTRLPVAGMASSRLGHRIERLLVPDPPPDPKQRWFAPAVLALLVTTASAAPRVGTSTYDQTVDSDLDQASLSALSGSSSAPSPAVVLAPNPVEAAEVPELGQGPPSATLAPETVPTTVGAEWQTALRSEYALMEDELDLLAEELNLLRIDLGADQEDPLREALGALEERLNSLNTMREFARQLLEKSIQMNTSLASTPRARQTASNNTQP